MSPATSPRAALLASALLGANLAVVGPRSVHAANLGEYSASFWSIAVYLAAAAGVATAAVWGLLLAIPRRWRGRPVVLVFSAAALAWLQGNWLLADVGLLDGGDLDLAAVAEDRVRDAVLWLGGLAAAQLAYPVLRRHVAPLAGIFLALQLAALPLATAFDGADGGEAGSLALVADPALFELSRGPNVLLVILDTVTSDTFVRFAERERPRFDADFDGFVVYTDAVGAFPSTQYSLPVMLGAPPYDNRVPVADYMDAALRQEALTGSLMERGWSVDWVAAWPLFCRRGRASHCYAIPRPYGDPAEYRARMAAELIDLSLFRHAPSPLKAWLYAGGEWRLQPALFGAGDPPLFVSSAARFYADYVASLSVARDRPTFKIVHTGGGHGPFVLDAACNLVPKRRYAERSYQQQLRCSLAQTAALLRRLRALGVYDDAAIVVAGDHGSSFGSRPRGPHGLTSHRLSRSRPLLAVKWPGAEGGLRFSPAPASLADVAPTLAAAAGLEDAFPGVDLATLPRAAPRRRDYGLYALRRGTPGGYLERVERYAVAPESRRPEAWRFEGAVFSPAVSLPPGRIAAGSPAATRHFSLLGWGSPGRSAEGVLHRPALGPVATVFAELPEGAAAELRVRLRADASLLPQVVSVEVAGRRIGAWRIREPGFRDYALAIPRGLAGPHTTAVTFLSQKTRGAAGRRAIPGFELAWLDLVPAAR